MAGDVSYENASGGSTPVSPDNPLPIWAFPTFKYLDDIVTILGTTKNTLMPFLEKEDEGYADFLTFSYRGNAQQAVVSGDATEPFYVYRHTGGIHSYYLAAAENQLLTIGDHADFSFGSNAAFSLGLWIFPQAITSVDYIAKYDLGATDREWKLGLDGSSKIELEVYDETNDEDRTGASDTALVANEWAMICATYDGADADASMDFYLNGAADGSGNTESGAAFASSVAGATALTFGASLNSAAAVAESTGRIALPFITGKELTAAEVASLYALGNRLLGIA